MFKKWINTPSKKLVPENLDLIGEIFFNVEFAVANSFFSSSDHSSELAGNYLGYSDPEFDDDEEAKISQITLKKNSGFSVTMGGRAEIQFGWDEEYSEDGDCIDGKWTTITFTTNPEYGILTPHQLFHPIPLGMLFLSSEFNTLSGQIAVGQDDIVRQLSIGNAAISGASSGVKFYVAKTPEVLEGMNKRWVIVGCKSSASRGNEPSIFGNI
jgi:hypothetical protein